MAKATRSARKSTRSRDGRLWRRHSADWRAPEQAATNWSDADATEPALLRFKVYGEWWDLLARHGITLLVTREYEHLIIAMSVVDREPRVSFMPMPHPSGLAVDRRTGATFVASTRNPNQVYEFRPSAGRLSRLDVDSDAPAGKPLLPVASRFFPGCFYLHDLAFVGGELFANSVGQNAVVRLDDGPAARPVWWPKCIERAGAPVFGQNHIQLNSIAAGETLETSYFSASSDAIETLRPGDPRYRVDGRGVIMSGMSREPVTRGLTRPHSARLTAGALWVANSGYGQLCRCDADASTYTVVATLPGWTRGLAFHDEVAFVGSSRVIPRFSSYAPGLNEAKSICGVHAVDARTGHVLGGLIWPHGNQVFAVEWIDGRQTKGFPFPAAGRRATQRERDLFYAYDIIGATCREVR